MQTTPTRIVARLGYVVAAGLIALPILRIARPVLDIAVLVVYARLRDAISDASFGQDRYPDEYA
ncbi:hypothetical protein [Nocardia sp. NPDC051570]|uniref:hypothetical protein n=1 Tax=Nocardia sp. NPDC051570 TaxID=3364324 RepID=UPI0037AF5789